MALHAPTDAFGRPSRAVPSGWETLDSTLRADERGASKDEEETRVDVEAALTALLERRSLERKFSSSKGGGAARSMSTVRDAGARAHAPRGFARGAVHEWFGTVSPSTGSANSKTPPQKTVTATAHGWSPPLFLFVHLAHRATEDARQRGAPAHVVWIGRRVWPYPRALDGSAELRETKDREFRVFEENNRSLAAHAALEFTLELREATFPSDSRVANATLFERSVFVDPGRSRNSEGETLWAIDTALRSPSVTAIVADGSGLGMAATRRLQLVAADSSALVLLARPPDEVGEVSAATTRWIVERDLAWEQRPRWRVKLLRAKGAQSFARGVSLESE